jgi:hypothetical protein
MLRFIWLPYAASAVTAEYLPVFAVSARTSTSGRNYVYMPVAFRDMRWLPKVKVRNLFFVTTRL